MYPFGYTGDMVEGKSLARRTVSTTSDIGNLLRERREELHLTQKEIAEKLGVSRKWYIEMEQGKPTIELYRVLDVFWALDLTLQIEVKE